MPPDAARDPTYLALAEAVDAQPLTLDGRLAVAAGRRAVALGGRHRLEEVPLTYPVLWAAWRGAGEYLDQLASSLDAAPGRR